MFSRIRGQGFNRVAGIAAAIVFVAGSSATLAGPGGAGNAAGTKKAHKAASTPTTAPSDKSEKPIAKYIGVIDNILASLTLSDDQKTKIKVVEDDFKQSRQTWADQNAAQVQALHDQLKAAQQAKNNDQVKQLRAQIKTLTDGAPAIKDLTDKVRAVLTAEQAAAFDQQLHDKSGAVHPKKSGKTDAPTTQPASGGAATQA